MNGNIEFRENFVRCSDCDVALILAESIVDDADLLNDRKIDIKTWIGQPGHFAEGGDNSSFHGLDELKHDNALINNNNFR